MAGPLLVEFGPRQPGFKIWEVRISVDHHCDVEGHCHENCQEKGVEHGPAATLFLAAETDKPADYEDETAKGNDHNAYLLRHEGRKDSFFILHKCQYAEGDRCRHHEQSNDADAQRAGIQPADIATLTADAANGRSTDHLLCQTLVAAHFN